MKELFRLKSFQQILLLLFFLGFTIGVLYGIYLFSSDKFRYYSIIPALPALFFISRGLYKKSNLFFTDFKSIITKS
jgi:hypothetical protein